MLETYLTFDKTPTVKHRNLSSLLLFSHYYYQGWTDLVHEILATNPQTELLLAFLHH